MDQDVAPTVEVAPVTESETAAGEQEPPKRTPPSPYVVAHDRWSSKAAELCEKASHFDYMYLGTFVALDVGTLLVDPFYVKGKDSLFLRIAAPAAFGLSWGATLGSLPLVTPQCEWPGTPRVRGPESTRHDHLAMMIALAGLAGASAPFIVGLATGPLPRDHFTTGYAYKWPVSERSGRLIAAGVGGALGTLLPYLLPPKPFSAIKELRELEVTTSGTDITFRLQF